MQYHNTNLMEDCVMRKSLVFGLAVMGIWLLGGQLVAAQDKAHAELAKALLDANLALSGRTLLIYDVPDASPTASSHPQFCQR